MVCGACATTSTRNVVQSQFSATYTCPSDQISITPRPDIQGHTVMIAPTSPPADVANDQTRLRLWEERTKQKEAEADQRKVYEVVGCGHTERYACARLSGGGDNDADWVDCRDTTWVRLAADHAAAIADLKETDQQISARQDELKKAADTLELSKGNLSEFTKLAAKVAARENTLGATLAPGDKGLVVLRVMPGAASDGKLQSGDVIVSVDGVAITGLADLLHAATSHTAGTPLSLMVKRGNDTQLVFIALRQ